MSTEDSQSAIKAIDGISIHRITSGQVVIDLQTAVKELVENSLDAGATSIEVRFKEYGLKSIEVVDNGTGIAPEDYDSVALKHHTSKLSSFSDLSTVRTFGFRGEALSSLCALSDEVSICTATASQTPMGTVLEIDRNGKVKSRGGRAARQRGTTITVTGLFKPLPVRRKELERNAKREFGKALNLLNAYALVPCTQENKGVRLTVSNQPEGGRKSVQLRTEGTPSIRASLSALWGSKSLENIVDLDLSFEVEVERAALRGLKDKNGSKPAPTAVRVRGLISSFQVGCGRTGTDRQFFFINGRPCNHGKVQKALNEVYRTFNILQSPFVVADFILPTESCDINVSPDKRTIFLHSEGNLLAAFKAALEKAFSPSRSTFTVSTSTGQKSAGQTQRSDALSQRERSKREKGKVHSPESEDEMEEKPSQAEENDSSIEADADVSMTMDSDPEEGFSVGTPSGLLGLGRSTSADVSPATGKVPTSTTKLPAIYADDDTIAQDQLATDSRTYLLESSVVTPPPLFLPDTELDDEVPPATSHVRSSSLRPPSSPVVTHLPQERSLSPHQPSPSTVPRDVISSSTTRKQTPVQMVLSTTGASWNLRRGAPSSPPSEAPPKKKSRFDNIVGGRGMRGASRITLRSQISAFAMAGSKVGDDDEVEVEEDHLLHEEDDARCRADGDDDDEGPVDAGEETGNRIQKILREDDSRKQITAEDLDASMDVDQSTGPDSSDLRMAVSDTDEQEDRIASPTLATRKDSQLVVDLTSNASDHSEDQDLSLIATTEPGNSSQLSDENEGIARPEIIRTSHGGDVSLDVDFSKISRTWCILHEKLAAVSHIATSDSSKETPALIKDASVSNAEDDEKAAEALSRVIDKEDFGAMDILGQFNLGFIVTRRRKLIDNIGNGGMDDLFIVDQHAADEKYNFETLQQTTNIQCQKLFRPEPLELTAADELLAIENMDVLQQNGFQINIDENAIAGQGQRLKLVAQPVSKSTVFDMKDLEELLHLMQDRPTGQMVRCTKARAMFAMRACRKSVMVGMPLTKGQMTSVVRHMGTMDQPWNCPHGRPTMRHLSDITGIPAKHIRNIDWTTFGPA